MMKERKLSELNNLRTLKEDSKNNDKQISTGENRIKYKGIEIPKLLLNKKISNFYNIKNYNYSHKKRDNISSKNFLFLERPLKNEITNYYYSKNKNVINDISLNSKRKLNKHLPTISGINQNNINNSKRKSKSIKSRIFSMIMKKNIKKESEKNSMNTSFLSSKPDDPFLDIKIQKYLKEKENERDNLFILINNPFGRSQNGKSILFPEINRKLMLQKLLKPKCIKSDIYDSIMKEYNNTKPLSNEKIERNLIRNKLYRNKIRKHLNTKKYVNNPMEVQDHLIDNQMKLIKKKLYKNYADEINYDFFNDYKTKLYLSLSHSKDQVLNIKSTGKLINDGSVLKDLVEEAAKGFSKKECN